MEIICDEKNHLCDVFRSRLFYKKVKNMLYFYLGRFHVNQNGSCMKVLLTFVGYHDPYYKGPLEDEELKGPILYLLGLRSFDRVILFATPNLAERTVDTVKAIGAAYPGMETEIVDCAIDDPTDYGEIFASIRKRFKTIDSLYHDAEYHIATASGTPQMHAVWFMLAASGEIPAKILQARPPQFVTSRKQAVDEIDPLSAGFPRVRAPAAQYEQEELRRPNISRIVEELGIIGKHPSFEEALERAAMFAETSCPVLIQGETGTGKEIVARLIHRLSGRPASRFVPINCAALPNTLAESILFGHKKGAFTGADRDQIGKFVQADGGTLFFDEIGELPPEIQGKLLRILEDGIVEPVGSSAGGQKVNVRIIAATNRELNKDVEEGRFRKDLYFRIEVGLITLPTLRERRSDIPLLALYGMDNINKKLKKSKRLSQDAIQGLLQHAWPGNVRQLLNLLERSALAKRKEVIEKGDMLFTEDRNGSDIFSSFPDPGEGFVLEDFLVKIRVYLIHRALELSNNNQSKAARNLGITPQAVHNFLKREGISGFDN
jgi:DNA-binding NtrC family response regulator